MQEILTASKKFPSSAISDTNTLGKSQVYAKILKGKAELLQCQWQTMIGYKGQLKFYGTLEAYSITKCPRPVQVRQNLFFPISAQSRRGNENTKGLLKHFRLQTFFLSRKALNAHVPSMVSCAQRKSILDPYFSHKTVSQKHYIKKRRSFNVLVSPPQHSLR